MEAGSTDERDIEAAGVAVPTVQADGERTPFRDATFDLVWCDHGAMSFADPYHIWKLRKG